MPPIWFTDTRYKRDKHWYLCARKCFLCDRWFLCEHHRLME